MRRAAIIALVGAGLVACSWGDALRSDASAWDPARGEGDSGYQESGASGASAEDQTSGDCPDTPALDLEVAQSSPGSVSHRRGEPCLDGCHEAGGSARLTLAAAGTAYRAEGTRTLAAPGAQVRGVGGSVLAVDACGNFYAIAASLAANPRNTQPWVKEPTFRRMEKPLLRVARPGDCNQSGCHDFSGRLNAGIYF